MFSYTASRMKKTIIIPTLIISTLFLAACNQPQQQQTDMSGYNTMYKSQESGLAADGTQAAETTQQLDTQTQQTVPNPREETMSQKTVADFEKIQASQVTLKTNKGDITFEIYTDKVPVTAANFLNLSKEGFYNGVVFHRVISNFMIQVGDPLSKDASKKAMWGTGSPGYTIADEFVPELKHDSPGIVSMANSGPNTGGSQFFITHGPTEWLDGKHTVFGKVTSGMDVVNSIAQGDTIISVSYK